MQYYTFEILRLFLCSISGKFIMSRSGQKHENFFRQLVLGRRWVSAQSQSMIHPGRKRQSKYMSWFWTQFQECNNAVCHNSDMSHLTVSEWISHIKGPKVLHYFMDTYRHSRHWCRGTKSISDIHFTIIQPTVTREMHAYTQHPLGLQSSMLTNRSMKRQALVSFDTSLSSVRPY